MIEQRAIIRSVESAAEMLLAQGAESNGTYSYTDYIYSGARLRVRHVNNWGPIKSDVTVAGVTTQFDTEEQAREFLTKAAQGACIGHFRRVGVEYRLNATKVFLERIEGVPDTVEVEGATEREVVAVLDTLAVQEILRERTAAWVLRQIRATAEDI